MRRLISTIFVLCFSFFVTTAQDEDIADFPFELSDVQQLDDLIDARGRTNLSLLSPDGNLIVYEGDNNLCIYDFTTEENTCFPFIQVNSEGEPIHFPPISNLSWSMDNTQIALTPPALQFLVDSDIWVLNVETGDYTNFTDDGYEGTLPFQEDDTSNPFIDLLPTWSPSGDLYFFRYTDFPIDTITTKLYRIAPNEQEAVLVADYSSEVDRPFAFYDNPNMATFDGSASISPDGTQMAVFYRDIDFQNDSIWVINLEDGSLQETILLSRTHEIGLPEWGTIRNALQTVGMSWVDSSNLVFTTLSATFDNPFWMIYHVDISTNDIQAVFDYSNIPSASDFLANDSPYDNPTFVVSVPDSPYLLFTESPSFSPIGVSTVSVMGGESTRLYEFEQDDYRQVRTVFSSVGRDEQTLRVILAGVVYTFADNDSQ